MSAEPIPEGPAADGTPAAVAAVLARARTRFPRLEAPAAAAAIAGGALLVDIRPEGDRLQDGTIPGAVVVERTVLEWSLAPAGERRLAELRGPHHPVVLLSRDGDASSLAAPALLDVGLTRVTDVIGGFIAWQAAGLPVTEPPRRTVLRFAAV
jgi:rhodanese-related sulfurtransferase